MKTKILALGIIGVMLLAGFGTLSAEAKGPTKMAGNSNIGHLYLYEKTGTPGENDWEIVENGSWGKMTYNTDTAKYVFNGHQLMAGANYTLINFARNGTEWPATINILGNGTANEGGNIHIAGYYEGELEYDTTPVYNETGDIIPDFGENYGYKIWLVPSEDIVDGMLSGWSPNEILFEEAGI